MARFSAHHTLHKNLPFRSKDKLAEAAFTKNSSTPAMLCTSILTVALVFALSSMPRYLKKDLKRIFQIVLEAKPSFFSLYTLASIITH